MPAAGYWMYFYDKKSPATLRNAYYKNQKGSVVPAPNSLQLDENCPSAKRCGVWIDLLAKKT